MFHNGVHKRIQTHMYSLTQAMRVYS